MQKDKLRQVAGALYKIMKRDGRPWQDIELQRELIKGRVIGYDRICLVKRALQRDSRFRHWGGSYFVLAGSAQANASIMEFYRDRVKGILQENQKLFYRTIADELSRKLGFDVNPNHVNMALSKGRDFVRVGDGIYRLKGPEEEAHKPPDKSLTGWIVEAFRQEDRFMDMNDLCEALVKITGRQYHRTTLSGILSNGIYEFLGPVCGLWGLKDWKGRKESEAVKEILSMPLHCAITKDNFRTCAIAVPAKIGVRGA